MGNPSEQIPEVKKGVFRIFEFFFEKSWIFSEKNENWSKMAEKFRKVQKIFQTQFPIILMIWAHWNQIWAIFVLFWAIFVVLRVPTSGPNPSGRDQKKSTFFASSHYLGPQTKFLSQNICALLLKTQFHRANRFFEILHLQWSEVRIT